MLFCCKTTGIARKTIEQIRVKITLSKKQWLFIGRQTNWIRKNAQTPVAEVVVADEMATAKSTVDQEIFDRKFGKHDFYVYSLPEIEKILQQNNISLLVEGMGVDSYLRQKVLKKYNLM